MKHVTILTALIALLVALASPAHAGRCANGRSSSAAMWLSIAHPGLGEYFLLDFGPWRVVPKKKIFLGFIPFYGWPGYLQIKSAIDAAHCQTNDDVGWG